MPYRQTTPGATNAEIAKFVLIIVSPDDRLARTWSLVPLDVAAGNAGRGDGDLVVDGDLVSSGRPPRIGSARWVRAALRPRPWGARNG